MNSNRLLHILCLAVIVVAYIITRFHGLEAIPLFIDEAIHIKFAKDAMSGDFLAGMYLGKWLSIQTYGLFLKAFTDIPFFARLLVVIVGLSIMVMLYIQGTVFDGSIMSTRGTWGAMIYLVAPYTLFYDRVALTDQFLTLLLSLIVWFSFRVSGEARLYDFAGLCLALLLGPLFKFTGVLFVPVPLVIVAITSKRKILLRKLRKLSLLYGIYFPLMFLVVKYCLPKGDLDKLGVDHSLLTVFLVAGRNIRETAFFFWNMLTPGLCLFLILGCAAVLILSRDSDARQRTLASAIVIVTLLLPYMLIRAYYPRYHLPILVPICILSAEIGHFLVSLTKKLFQGRNAIIAKAMLFVLLLAYPAAWSFSMLRNPMDFPYHGLIKWQYFTGWTSGYGLKETVNLLLRLSKSHPEGILVLHSPRWDHPLLGIDVYYHEIGNKIKRRALQPWDSQEACKVIHEALQDGSPTYLLFNRAYPYPGDKDVISQIGRTFAVHEIAHYMKPGDTPGLCVWHLSELGPHSN